MYKNYPGKVFTGKKFNKLYPNKKFVRVVSKDPNNLYIKNNVISDPFGLFFSDIKNVWSDFYNNSKESKIVEITIPDNSQVIYYFYKNEDFIILTSTKLKIKYVFDSSEPFIKKICNTINWKPE